MNSIFVAGRLPISRSWLQSPQKKRTVFYVFIFISRNVGSIFEGREGFLNPKPSERGFLHLMTHHTVDGLLILHQLRKNTYTPEIEHRYQELPC